tara:strand:+ start:136 stop:582 length:447 start_codon:yes stop_codon:yes gene_type:complete
MTKKDLVKIIREVVRREVQKEVQKIFIKEETSPKLQNIVSEIKEPSVTPSKTYTKNEALNKVLNETVALSKKQPTEEYPTLGGGTFDTNRMTELLGYGKSEEVKRDMVAVDTMKKMGVTLEQVPEAVTNALTRDYSDLMKALDKKKGR